MDPLPNSGFLSSSLWLIAKGPSPRCVLALVAALVRSIFHYRWLSGMHISTNALLLLSRPQESDRLLFIEQLQGFCACPGAV